MTSSSEQVTGATGVGISDARVEEWLRSLQAGLSLESAEALQACEALVQWMLEDAMRTLQKIAGRFRVPRQVLNEMLEHARLRHELRNFLTLPGSDHPAACPAVTAYLAYADHERRAGKEARGFRAWCFHGRWNRFGSFGERYARDCGAPPQLFRAADSGGKARRRMAEKGELVEYLRLSTDRGFEIWRQRRLHPQGDIPANAVRATERRYLVREEAIKHLDFTITAEQHLQERSLEEGLNKASGVLGVQGIGQESYRKLLLWLFDQLDKPFPLRSTTLDALFAATVRYRELDAEQYSDQRIQETEDH